MNFKFEVIKKESAANEVVNHNKEIVQEEKKVLTEKALASKIAAKHSIDEQVVLNDLGSAMQLILEALSQGQSFPIKGFGTFHPFIEETIPAPNMRNKGATKIVNIYFEADQNILDELGAEDIVLTIE